MDVITVRNVHKIYRESNAPIHALAGISLSIRPDEFVVVTGAEGSGKSALLYALAGLEPVTAGEIIVNGKRVDLMDEEELAVYRNRDIGFVFQSDSLIGSLSVIENTALPLLFTGVPKRIRHRMAAALLKTAGLENFSDYTAHRLTEWQKQRVGIARAFITDPSFILAVEPAGNLGSQNRYEILSLLARLSKTLRKPVIMITDDIETTVCADRVIQLKDGRLRNADTENRVNS